MSSSSSQKMVLHHQTPLPSVLKAFIAQLNFFSLLSYFLLFACGLTSGLILALPFNNFSLSLRFIQFPIKPNSTAINLNASSDSVLAYNVAGRKGLEEYIKPPDNVMHEMEEEELFWRASMKPQIPKYPYERIPKVAFLFLTRGAVVFAPLWENFFKGHSGLYSIYVHSNPSYNDSHPESSVFHARRIPNKEVEWGNINMMEAERRLLANALLDFSNQRFILLSESCIPLFNFTTIYSYLINSTKSHVMVYDDPGPDGRGRYDINMYPTISILQWRKGSQWFEMDRELAIEVVSDQEYFPAFKNTCRGLCYADEHYLATLVNMKFGEGNSNRSLTWVDWSTSGPHPAMFTEAEVTIEVLKRLRNENWCDHSEKLYNDVCFLFARKFSNSSLDVLMRIAPQIMHFSTL